PGGRGPGRRSRGPGVRRAGLASPRAAGRVGSSRHRGHRPGTGVIRRAIAALIATLLAVVLSVVGAAPALAHNVLVSSDPTNGAVLDTALQQVSFTFDQPIQNFDPALKVFGPNGNDFTTAAPTIEGTTISAPIAAGPAGDYRAAYRIVSADGHPVTGEITFTLTDAAAGTASGTPPSASGSDTDSSDAGGSQSGLGVWLWVIVAAAVVLVVLAIVITLRKPRDE